MDHMEANHLKLVGRGMRELGYSHPGSCHRTVLSILGTDLQCQLSREWIRHGMEGLHGRQPVCCQLPPHFGLQPDKQILPVLPFADALQAVDQIREGLREVRPQLQRSPVRRDGRVLPRRVLVGGREVGMRLRRIRLQQSDMLIAGDGLRRSALHLEDPAKIVVGYPQALRLLHGSHLGVGLHGPCHLSILRAGKLQLDAHGIARNGLVSPAGLPERISQVVVGLRKVWLPGDRLLVGLNGLIQLALLIVHACSQSQAKYEALSAGIAGPVHRLQRLYCILE